MAVDLVRERVGELVATRAVVVGAGKAGLLVARALRSSGVESLTVVNRSEERARAVAEQVGGTVAPFAELGRLLADADVVLSATGADGVVVDARTVKRALAARDSAADTLLLLDLAMPGDIDPDVRALDGVELLTLEDVKARVHRHLSLRRDELGAAEKVVEEVVEDFIRKQDAPDVDRLIGALRRNIEEVRSAEVERWLEARSGSGAPTREELDRLTRSIVNKLLHDRMIQLRSAPLQGARARLLIRAAGDLLGLDSGQASAETTDD